MLVKGFALLKNKELVIEGGFKARHLFIHIFHFLFDIFSNVHAILSHQWIKLPINTYKMILNYLKILRRTIPFLLSYTTSTLSSSTNTVIFDQTTTKKLL